MWVFKQLYDKGLLYEDFRVMPYSWTCQTPVSNAETKQDNSYREKADKAITVKFKMTNNAVEEFKKGGYDFGVLICGSGIGISIAANRFSHIRCALCYNSTLARLSREHNDANVLCFGARVVGRDIIKDMVEVFFATEFSGGRHEKRVEKLGAF